MRRLRKRYGRSIDPAGGYAQVQRMMKVYAEHAGLGAYVANTALPTGQVQDGHGIWAFYARKTPSSKSVRHTVDDLTLREYYARKGAS